MVGNKVFKIIPEVFIGIILLDASVSESHFPVAIGEREGSGKGKGEEMETRI